MHVTIIECIAHYTKHLNPTECRCITACTTFTMWKRGVKQHFVKERHWSRKHNWVFSPYCNLTFDNHFFTQKLVENGFTKDFIIQNWEWWIFIEFFETYNGEASRQDTLLFWIGVMVWLWLADWKPNDLWSLPTNKRNVTLMLPT